MSDYFENAVTNKDRSPSILGSGTKLSIGTSNIDQDDNTLNT